jgi:hypothetical protein
MRNSWFAPATFMMVFCCAYAFVFAMDWPLFRYYPLHDDFNWGPRVQKGVGPAVAWYGLMCSAGIVAFFAAICVPDRAVDALFRNYLWAFPCAAMLICLFLLRHFFN